MRHPEWARECSDCEKYVYGENGKRSEYEDCVNGRVVVLPMLRADYLGSRPPCDVCPKHEGAPEAGRKPLPPDMDFGDWLYDLRQLYREGRVVGYGDIDPLMAAVFAEFHDADQAQRQDDLCRAIVLGVISSTRK